MPTSHNLNFSFSTNIDGDDESDREHAQDGQAPVVTVRRVPGYQWETQRLHLFQEVVSL